MTLSTKGMRSMRSLKRTQSAPDMHRPTKIMTETAAEGSMKSKKKNFTRSKTKSHPLRLMMKMLLTINIQRTFKMMGLICKEKWQCSRKRNKSSSLLSFKRAKARTYPLILHLLSVNLIRMP